MHDIEPWWGWRDEYASENDPKSPFYGRVYDEFNFNQQIYNYYIHPQWDDIGSETLFAKLLYVDYRRHFACLELIGEWNDCIGNDIMYLKRDIIDKLIKHGISRFAVFCDNILNYHGDDDSYYEEWYEDIRDEQGWICLINTFDHVVAEMSRYRLQYYLNYGPEYNEMSWRIQKPAYIVDAIEYIMFNKQKTLQ